MIRIATIEFHNGKSETKAGAGYRGYHTLDSLKRLIEYATNDDKTKPWLIGSLNCNTATAYEEMVLTKQLYGKDVEDGKNRMLIHFSQHFVAGETTEEIAHEIAERLVQHPLFKGFQVVYGTHLDTGNLHNHFIVNSVNAGTGKKWHISKKDLENLKQYSDSIIKEYGLYVVPKPEQKVEHKTHAQLIVERDARSWKYETYLAVKLCKEIATSRAAFVKAMNKIGYQVNWTDERKYITFTNPDGMKVRNCKLYPQAQFTKEALEKCFALNKQYQELSKDQKEREAMDNAFGMLKLINSLSKLGKGGKYPLQRLEKDYSSMAARKELAKEAEKGRGIDWER